MRGSTILIVVSMVIGLLVLGALGTWQVKRMIWKEQLIERVNERIRQEPLDLMDILPGGLQKENHEYQPVSVSGIYDHSREVYFFTTGKGGASGWNVHTPLLLSNGKALIVNRGFVPFDRKLPATREVGQVDGTQNVIGLLRFPLLEQPFGSLPNDLENRDFYWRNVVEMSSLMQTEDKRDFIPVILDASEQPVPGDWPKGGTTIVSFPNNHLQYAVTWYGLALTLLGVGGFFLYSRRNGNDG